MINHILSLFLLLLDSSYVFTQTSNKDRTLTSNRQNLNNQLLNAINYSTSVQLFNIVVKGSDYTKKNKSVSEFYSRHVRDVNTDDKHCLNVDTCKVQDLFNHRVCHCDELCISYCDCCSDVKVSNETAEYASDQTEILPETDCMDINGNHKRFRVVTTCQTNNRTISENALFVCENNNNSLIYSVPVIDNRGIVYRNEFCAKCNGVSSFQFFYVKTNLNNCHDFTLLGESYASDDGIEWLWNNCKITFVPPRDTHLRTCGTQDDAEFYSSMLCYNKYIYQTYHERNMLKMCNITDRTIDGHINSCPSANKYFHHNFMLALSGHCVTGKQTSVMHEMIPLIVLAMFNTKEDDGCNAFGNTEMMIGSTKTCVSGVELVQYRRETYLFIFHTHSNINITKVERLTAVIKLILKDDFIEVHKAIGLIAYDQANKDFIVIIKMIFIFKRNTLLSKYLFISSVLNALHWIYKEIISNDTIAFKVENNRLAIKILDQPEVVLLNKSFAINISAIELDTNSSEMQLCKDMEIIVDVIRENHRDQVKIRSVKCFQLNTQSILSSNPDIHTTYMLTIVSYTGLCVSVCALVLGIFVSRRYDMTNTVNGGNVENVMLSMLLSHILYISGIGANDNETICFILGVAIHYATLSTYACMSVAVLYISRRFVRMTKYPNQSLNSNKNTRIWLTVLAFTLPFLLIVPCVVLDLVAYPYLRVGYSHSGVCFPTLYPANIVFVTVPILVSSLACFISIFMIMASISYMSENAVSTMSYRFKTYLVVNLKLSSYSGIPYIVGLLGDIFENDVLQTIFVVLYSIQGFLIVLAWSLNKKLLKKVFKRNHRPDGIMMQTM